MKNILKIGLAIFLVIIIAACSTFKPSIVDFKSDKNQIAEGDSVTLSWSVIGDKKTEVIISGVNGNLPTHGDKIVTLTDTTVFILAAKRGEQIITKKVTVNVTKKPEIKIDQPKKEEKEVEPQVTIFQQDSIALSNEKLKLSAEYSKVFNVIEKQNIDYSKISTIENIQNNSADIRKVIEKLVGQGIKIKNVTISNNANKSWGFFHNKKKLFGMDKGVIMTSGSYLNAFGPNISTNSTQNNSLPGDRSLDNEIGDGKTYDACIIEFDFLNMSDTLAFSYIFGSEEYEEYVGTAFNDVFGVFLSGDGLTNEINLAKINHSTININSINNGNPLNSDLQPNNNNMYIYNEDNSNPEIGYDGFTRIQTVKFPLKKSGEYKLKFAIADVGDHILDAGVFIEGQSIISYNKRYTILFGADSTNLEVEDLRQLDSIVYLKNINKGAKFYITGHTSAEGSLEYNNLVSKRRVNNVVEYLVSKGISKKMIISKHKGPFEPVGDNSTSNGKKINRRVEILVTN